MAKQDDWSRITLRLPRDLHEVLVDRAGVKSLNAEIVERLERSLSQPNPERDNAALRELKEGLDRNERLKEFAQRILDAAHELDLDI